MLRLRRVAFARDRARGVESPLPARRLALIVVAIICLPGAARALGLLARILLTTDNPFIGRNEYV